VERPLSPPPTNTLREAYPDISQWLQGIPPLIPRINKYTASLDVASVGAGIVSRQTFTVPEIDVSDSIFIKAVLPAGLEMLASYYVSAASTIVIPFWNTTGASINPAASIYTIWAFR
jgi:hypothetical protein